MIRSIKFVLYIRKRDFVLSKKSDWIQVTSAKGCNYSDNIGINIAISPNIRATKPSDLQSTTV